MSERGKTRVVLHSASELLSSPTVRANSRVLKNDDSSPTVRANSRVLNNDVSSPTVRVNYTVLKNGDSSPTVQANSRALRNDDSSPTVQVNYTVLKNGDSSTTVQVNSTVLKNGDFSPTVRVNSTVLKNDSLSLLNTLSIPCGKLGLPYLGKPGCSSRKSSAVHSCQCWVYSQVSRQWYGSQSLGFLTCAQMMHAILNTRAVRTP